jgi:hypothetical protein
MTEGGGVEDPSRNPFVVLKKLYVILSTISKNAIEPMCHSDRLLRK